MNKQSQVDLLTSRVSEYERKLSGATPEEARARIDSLEKTVAALQPRQRALSDDQKTILTNAVRGISVSSTTLLVIYPQVSHEAALYAHQFADAFKEGGWDGEPDIMFHATHRLKYRGITFAVSDLSTKSEIANTIGDALNRASIKFTWGEVRALAGQHRLFIDMID